YMYTGCPGCQLTDFPILNAYQPCLDQQPPPTIQTVPTCLYTTPPSNSDAFVAKMNPNAVQGQQLLWSSYLGGSGTDTGTGIAVDTGAANVYITGTTNSPDITLLVTFAAFQTCLDQYPNPASGMACTNTTVGTVYPNDAYVARFTNPSSTTVGTTNLSLNYFSYLGGRGDDDGLAIAVDTAAGAILTGSTKSTNFPVLPASNDIQSHLLGPQNAFMARINTVA